MADDDVERAAVEEILKSSEPQDDGEPPSTNNAESPAVNLSAPPPNFPPMDFSIPPPSFPPSNPPASGSMAPSAAAAAAALAAGTQHWSQRGRTDLVSTLRNPIRPEYGRGGGRGRGYPDVVTTLRNPPGPFINRRRRFIGLDDENLSDEESWNRTREGTRREYDPNGDYIYDARKYFDPDKYRQICANRRKKMDKQMEVEFAAEEQHRSYLAYMSGHYPYVKPIITRPLPPIRTDSDSDEFDYEYYEDLTRQETIAVESAEPMYDDQFRYDEFFAPYPEPPPFDDRRFDDPMFYEGGGYNDGFYRGPPGPPFMMEDPPPHRPPGEDFGDRFRGEPYHGEDRRRSRSRGAEKPRSFSRSPGPRREGIDEKAEAGPEERDRRYENRFSRDRSPGRRFPDDRDPRYYEFPDRGRGRYGFDRGGFNHRGGHDFGRGGYRPYDRPYGRGSRYDRMPEFDERRGERWAEGRRGGRESPGRDSERRQRRDISQSSIGRRRRRSGSERSYSSSDSSPDTRKKQRSEVAAVKRRPGSREASRDLQENSKDKRYLREKSKEKRDLRGNSKDQRDLIAFRGSSNPERKDLDRKRGSASQTKDGRAVRGASKHTISSESSSSNYSSPEGNKSLRKRYEEPRKAKLKSKLGDMPEDKGFDGRRKIRLGDRSPGGANDKRSAIKDDNPSKSNPVGRSSRKRSMSPENSGQKPGFEKQKEAPGVAEEVSNVRRRNFRNRSSSSSSSSSSDSRRIIKGQAKGRGGAMAADRQKSAVKRPGASRNSFSSSTSESSSEDMDTRRVRYSGTAGNRGTGRDGPGGGRDLGGNGRDLGPSGRDFGPGGRALGPDGGRHINPGGKDFGPGSGVPAGKDRGSSRGASRDGARGGSQFQRGGSRQDGNAEESRRIRVDKRAMGDGRKGPMDGVDRKKVRARDRSLSSGSSD